MLIQLLGDAYTTLSPAFAAMTCINMYPELDNPHYHHYLEDDRKAKYPGYMVNTPGTYLFSSMSGATNSVRGLFEYNGVLYVVADGNFYTITQSSNGTITQTLKGHLNTTTGQVRMVANYTQIGIFDGSGTCYVYTPSTNVYATIGSAQGFNGATHAVFQDGYTCVVNPGTNTFQLSNLNDMTTWPGNYVSSISGYADILQGVISLQLEFLLFGLYHSEIWDNVGTTPFPLARHAGVNIELGCIAPLTIAKLDNTVFWLTRDNKGQCLVTSLQSGYAPTNVSTDPIAAAMTSYSTVSDAFAYAYQDAGHVFYVITFPTANVTWVYDASSTMWHQRTSTAGPLVYQNPVQGRHISNCYAFFNGQHIVGDYQSNNLYIMSRNYFSDNGNPIIRERTMTHVTQDLKQSSISMLKIDCEIGKGTTVGAGNDPVSLNPQISLEISKDYGITWGRQRLRNLGPAGKFIPNYARWNALGRARNWTFRFRTSDPVPFRLLGVQIEVSQGSN